MYEYTDEFGRHLHTPQFGPPYEFKKKITCNGCQTAIQRFRRALCDKYGWAEWPDALKGSLEGE